MFFSCIRLESGNFGFVLQRSRRILLMAQLVLLLEFSGDCNPQSNEDSLWKVKQNIHPLCYCTEQFLQHILLVGPTITKGRILSLEGGSARTTRSSFGGSLPESTMLISGVNMWYFLGRDSTWLLPSRFVPQRPHPEQGGPSLQPNSNLPTRHPKPYSPQAGGIFWKLVVGWWAVYQQFHECSSHGRNNGTWKDW